MKSLNLSQKLNQLLNNEVQEIIIGETNSSFQSREELLEHLSEGSLLNISKIASQSLAIPSGHYVVWTTGYGNTMLVPTNETRPTSEVYEQKTNDVEVHTNDLLDNWSSIARILAESDESKESETSDNSDNTTGINTNIKMSTVDRSPIVRAMQQRGMTESDLADAVNVDKSTISRILRTPKDTQGDPGGRNPSIGLAASIANVLKMDAESMFPDIFGVPDDGLSAKKTPSNKGSGMNNAASGSTRRSKGLQ